MVALQSSFPQALIEQILGMGTQDEQLLYRDKKGNSAFSYFIPNPALVNAMIKNKQVQAFLRRMGLHGYFSYNEVARVLADKVNPQGTDYNMRIACVLNNSASLQNVENL